MKVQLKTIKVLKTVNDMGTGKLLAIVKSSVVVDLDSFSKISQQYFSKLFPNCVVVFDYKEIK